MLARAALALPALCCDGAACTQAAPKVMLPTYLLVAAAFLFATRNGSGNSSGTPKITVDQQKVDYGYVKFGTNETFRIKVTNVGDSVLRFKEKPTSKSWRGVDRPTWPSVRWRYSPAKAHMSNPVSS